MTPELALKYFATTAERQLRFIVRLHDLIQFLPESFIMTIISQALQQLKTPTDVHKEQNGFFIDDDGASLYVSKITKPQGWGGGGDEKDYRLNR